MPPFITAHARSEEGLGQRGPQALSVCAGDASPRPAAAAAHGAGVLREVLHPGVAVAIWRRDLSQALHDAMAALDAFIPQHRLFALGPDEEPAPALDRALVGFGRLPVCRVSAWREDLLLLIAAARTLGPQADVRMRIETKVNEACRLFHADNVPLRMICTYRGPGTQWLPDGAFDRAGLGRGSNDHVRDWSAVRELATGEVGVMKGLCYPGGRADALIHRSPPATPAQPRVVVVIDVLL